ncbi:MAG: hypothetical protein ACYSOI_08850 [Planctomycetota bacterium]|jgi:hypothetical protein
MRNRNGISLLEALVVIAVIVVLFAIFAPPLGKVKTIAQRVVCGTNLKGLGTAMTVYANDYDDAYPQLPGTGPWSKQLGFNYDLHKSDFDGTQSDTPRTVTSSLYLLVREADVSPKSFVCPSSWEVEFDGRNPNNLDIVEQWDFGPDPHKHVSYPYHNPYGKFPANGKRSAAFAVMADMSPWFKDGDILSANSNKQLPPQIIDYQDESTIRKGNSLLHNARDAFFGTKHYDTGFGQNVTWADGHTSYEKQPNIGVKYDNIYTYWSTKENPTEQDKQGGTAPTGRSPENDAKSSNDSFLVL